MSSRRPAAELVRGLLCLGMIVSTSAEKKWESKVPAMFLFGDSVVDVGNNNYITGFPLLPQANIYPYGETYFQKPTGRWCDGRLVFDFIAEYLDLPYPKPYLQPGLKPKSFEKGVNFASAGSGILDTTYIYEGVINLSVQVQNYLKAIAALKKEIGDTKVSDILCESLFVFITGNNDVGAYTSNTTLQQQYTAAEYIGLLVAKLSKEVKLVMNSGARKVLIGGLGPLGCVPSALAATNSTGSCVGVLNTLTEAIDAQLFAYVDGLNAKMNSTFVVLSTQYKSAFTLEEMGTEYGFTHGNTACCGSGLYAGSSYACGHGNYTLCKDVEKHVFWDFTHLSERAYKILAELLWTNTSNTYPITIKQLTAL